MTRVRRLRAAVVAVLLSLALATGCSDDPVGSAEEPPPSGTAPPPEPTEDDQGPDDPGDGSTAAPVADPEHAVDPPGKRTGTLVGPDLRIYSKEPLSDELVEEITGNRRVERVERISLGDFGVQNGVITVAAVDPATYRNYAVREAAELQEIWDRVAGGELAIDKALGRRLQDGDGLPQARQRQGRRPRPHRGVRPAGAPGRRGGQREVGRRSSASRPATRSSSTPASTHPATSARTSSGSSATTPR